VEIILQSLLEGGALTIALYTFYVQSQALDIYEATFYNALTVILLLLGILIKFLHETRQLIVQFYFLLTVALAILTYVTISIGSLTSFFSFVFLQGSQVLLGIAMYVCLQQVFVQRASFRNMPLKSYFEIDLSGTSSFHPRHGVRHLQVQLPQGTQSVPVHPEADPERLQGDRNGYLRQVTYSPS
jgi:hypothetical protein